MSAVKYGKHFIPLESDPEVFTDLVHKLGVSRQLRFEDVFSLDEPDFLPHPALALVLIFPTSSTYEKQKARVEASRAEYTGKGPGEDVMWFRQTIHNACGFYGMLHAVANGPARDYIEPSSILDTLLNKSLNLGPSERALVLEGSDELEAEYAAAASAGSTAPPEDPEAEVDYHYICFVKSRKSGHLYELDGSSKGPLDKGAVLGPDEDVLGEGALTIVREYIEREKGEDVNFSLMALVLD